MTETHPLDLLRTLASVDGAGLLDALLAAAKRPAGSTPSTPAPPSLSDAVHCLLQTNQELWSLETQVRQVRFRPWKIARLKGEIDALNQRRQDIVNTLDAQVRKSAVARAGSGARLLHESPGQLLDRVTIEAVRACETERLAGIESNLLITESAAARADLEAIVARLVEICAAIAAGTHTVRAQPRTKLYLRASATDATRQEIAKIVRERDFVSLDTKVAMDLHREFQQEMRTFREEEFKLADIYMKVATFVGGAIVVLLTRLPFSAWLAGVVIAVQLFFWCLLFAYSARMRASHKTYRMLGRWVMRLRIAQASSAFFHHEVDVFGSGKGWQQQVRSLVYLAVAVTVMVLGALVLSYMNQPDRDPLSPGENSRSDTRLVPELAPASHPLVAPARPAPRPASGPSAALGRPN